MRFFFAHLSFLHFFFFLQSHFRCCLFFEFSWEATGNEENWMKKIQFNFKWNLWNFIRKYNFMKVFLFSNFFSINWRRFFQEFSFVWLVEKSLQNSNIFQVFFLSRNCFSFVSTKHKIFYAQNIKVLFSLRKYVVFVASV